MAVAAQQRFNESPVSAAKDGSIVVENTPGEADARSEIQFEGIPQGLANTGLRCRMIGVGETDLQTLD